MPEKKTYLQNRRIFFFLHSLLEIFPCTQGNINQLNVALFLLRMIYLVFASRLYVSDSKMSVKQI